MRVCVVCVKDGRGKMAVQVAEEGPWRNVHDGTRVSGQAAASVRTVACRCE